MSLVVTRLHIAREPPVGHFDVCYQLGPKTQTGEVLPIILVPLNLRRTRSGGGLAIVASASC